MVVSNEVEDGLPPSVHICNEKDGCPMGQGRKIRVLGSWRDIVQSSRYSIGRAIICIIALITAITVVSVCNVPAKVRVVTLTFQALSTIVGGCIIGLSSNFVEPALIAQGARDGVTMADLDYRLGWSSGIIRCIKFIKYQLKSKDKLWYFGAFSAMLMLLSGTSTGLIFTEGRSVNTVGCQVSDREEKVKHDELGAVISSLSDRALGVLVNTWRPGFEDHLSKSRALEEGFEEADSQAVYVHVKPCKEATDGTVNSTKVWNYLLSTQDTHLGPIMWPSNTQGVFFTYNTSYDNIGLYINAPNWNDGKPKSWYCGYHLKYEDNTKINCTDKSDKEHQKVCSAIKYVVGLGFVYNYGKEGEKDAWLSGYVDTSPLGSKLLSLKSPESVVKTAVWTHVEAAYSDMDSATIGECYSTENLVQVRWYMVLIAATSLMGAVIIMSITCKRCCENSPISWMDPSFGSIFKNGMDAYVSNYHHLSNTTYSAMLAEGRDPKSVLQYKYDKTTNHVGLMDVGEVAEQEVWSSGNVRASIMSLRTSALMN